MNSSVQSGNLTRDPELTATASGLSICKFGVAVNQRKKVGEEWVDVVHFFDWVYFGRQGELLAEKASKGDRVYCTGRAEFSSWEAEDGSKRSKVSFVADSVEGEWMFRKGSGVAPAQAQTGGEIPAGGSDDDIPF